ncbi:MAG: hypothetical protein GC200_05435 [Tepidisphaera sp.]|nr:hypothetical protein [Tepidisphaera sp.]
MFVLIYVASLTMMVTRWRGPRSRAIEVTRCSACDYDLAGLDRGVKCPECGDPMPHVMISRVGRALAWHGPRLAKWLMALPAWMLLFSVLAVFAQVLVALSYRVQGFGWETSMRAARSRELADIGESFGGLLVVLWPFSVATVVGVFVLHLRTKMWLRATVGLMIIGVSGCVVFWTLPYALLR